MNYKDVSRSVRRVAKRAMARNDLAKQVILKQDGTYRVFDLYSVEQVNGLWVVTSSTSDDIQFNSVKSALGWCVSYSTSRYNLARDLVYFDYWVGCKQADVDFLVHKLSDASLESSTRAILQARLSEDIYSRQAYKKQLSKSLNLAKYIKIKGTK